MKRYFLLLVITLLAYAPGFSQENDNEEEEESRYYISLRVIDKFTGDFIPSVDYVVMRSDSTVIYRGATDKAGNPNTSRSNGDIELNDPGTYTARFSKEGYEPQEVKFKIDRRSISGPQLQPIIMKKKPRQYELGEAVVTATKVKMVMRGDTIVYNADAFELQEGSMLDALVRLLPGVELRGGQITVNGRYVSSLLINGEDFFKGNPKIALDNLPSYYVDKVKVYERGEEDEYLMGRQENEERDIVMDVNLKKEYSVGWMANAEAAGGTEERYMMRLFGLRFTRNSRIALFGNVNNTNDTRTPGESGDWNPAWDLGNGRAQLKTGGLEYVLNDKYKEWKLQSNANVDYVDNRLQSETSSVTFMENGDVYGRQRYASRAKNLHAYTNHTLTIRKPNYFLSVNPELHYMKNRGRSSDIAAEFNDRIEEAYRGASLDSLYLRPGSNGFEDMLTHFVTNTAKTGNHEWKGSVRAHYSGKSFVADDRIRFTAGGDFSNYAGNTFSQYNLRYGKNADGMKPDFRNHYFDAPSNSYSFYAGGEYQLNFPSQLLLLFTYNYQQSYSSHTDNLFRLDRLDGWNSPEGAPAIGTLPSVTEGLMDVDNSEHGVLRSHVHKPAVELRYRKLSVGLPVKAEYASLDHWQNGKYHKSRHFWAVEPSVRYVIGRSVVFTYKYGVSAPALAYLLDVRNDRNPLSISLGNPNLKNTLSHRASLSHNSYATPGGKTRTLSWNANYVLTRRALSMARTYDRASGVSTWRPDNIDGNWHIDGSVDYSRALGKKQRFQLTAGAKTRYENNRDYISVDDKSAANSVRNLKAGGDLRGDYRLGNVSLGAVAALDYTYAFSSRPDFSTINVADFSYGLSALVHLPLKLELGTDITMFSRRGYDDNSMNDNNLVWNARLSRNFLKGGNLVVVLDGYDILGQISNVRRTVNAQGRVETWYNSLPSYFMTHIIYRLNRQPKKKGAAN